MLAVQSQGEEKEREVVSNTYENDMIAAKDRVDLSIRTALLVKSASSLIACQSWLVARLALKELRHDIDVLAEAIDKGSK